MRLEEFIKRVVQERIDAGYLSNVTANEAVDMYLTEGVIPEEAEWRYDEYLGAIWYDGEPKIFNVPNDWTLGELYHNLSVMLRFHKGFMKWE